MDNASHEGNGKGEDDMRDLPSAVRRYVWACYLCAVTVVAAHLWLVRAWLLSPTSPNRTWLLLVAQVLVFAVLAHVGELVALRLRGASHQSLGSAVHIAAILLFPPPLPLLIAWPAALALVATRKRTPLYKHAFNLCHSTLTVGVCSLVVARLATPPVALGLTRSGAALPILGVLLAVYYALDSGTALLLFALLERQAPWRLWWRTWRHTAIPELAACSLGVLIAALWVYNPLLVALFAVPVAGVRQNFRAVAQAERRSTQLEAVVTTGNALRVQQCAVDTLRRVASSARALSQATAVAAYVCDPDDPALLERLVLEPDDAPCVGPAKVPLPSAGRGFFKEAEDTGQTVLVPVEVIRDDGEVLVIGALRLMDLPVALTDDDRDVLALLATQAATALENARLHERALARALEDSLTELLNHRAFQTRLEEELARARRGGQSLAVVMIDLDGFGAVNNAHGHQAGDVTLLAVARCLREQTRQADVVARYGGDEFTLILPETELGDALDIAERIRGELAHLTVAHGTRAIRVTASIGVAVMPDHATTREDLVGAADNASYAAKRAGKDRVHRAEAGALPRDPVALAARLDDSNLATVEALASTVDAKDAYTRGHSGRVATYAAAIAAALDLPATDIARIRQAGILHDVGKIGVPDAILLKPDKLTAEEFAVIAEHPAIGEHILQGLPFLQEILPAVRHHHERWDGGGYPDGLAGDAIPADAAILAVADGFDAMTSSRTYRPALPTAEAIRRVREGAGTQYDSHVVAAFDRALTTGALVVPVAGGGELRALPQRIDVTPAHAGGARTGALRVVG